MDLRIRETRSRSRKGRDSYSPPFSKTVAEGGQGGETWADGIPERLALLSLRLRESDSQVKAQNR
ncbi:hypothetical protein FHS83_002036 [Rhizomicrobium palustre]|uniref:Uncharacterized protein n=1 Tax=Rhizomicrobium palustre TaxID=189966 RepID=A0A846MYL3_9PROT|nr:hypothetical protein [Rhizomicrobium palustre]